ncbi:MAG: hypothetical protein NC400_10430 [Clostridium sp.]|nr:hypothetical protein [Clostridium sp.]
MKKVYKVAKIVLFFLIIFALIGLAANITERKESRNKYFEFMELAEQVDVLFLGSSHVLNGVNPVQLYAEYGITSYNMGKPGGMVTESYWMLMNALDYCTPKCVVVDLWALDRDYKYLDIMNGVEEEENLRNSVSLLHTNMDCWPLSKTKISAVKDLISDAEIRKEFLWDFSLYHSRWPSLTSADFEDASRQTKSGYLLGAEQRTELYLNPRLDQPENTAQILPGKSVCAEYLDKIIEACGERKIDVVLSFLPMAVSYDEDWQAVNTAAQIAEEQDILFLNMLPHETQTVIDYYTDMSDDTHLNANGMRKMTSYIGSVLKNACGLSDHREEADYVKWQEKVGEWQASEIHKVSTQTDLYTELGEIQNMNASAVIFMRGDSKAIHDSLARRFIKQLTGSAVIDDALAANGPYLLIRDASGRTGEAVVNCEFGGENQTEGFETLLGTTSYIGLRDYGAIYVGEDYENNYLDMEEHCNDEVQILILGQQGEVISRLYYGSDWRLTENKE